MYKISEVAEMLGVSTIKIHELLVLHRSQLKIHVNREDGILSIDDKGYKKIGQLIFCEVSSKKKCVENTTELNQPSEQFNLVNQLNFKNDRELAAKVYQKKVIHLKETQSVLRQQLSKLDILIKREEEALLHYQQLVQHQILNLKHQEVHFIKKLLKH